ncbi:MAG: 16S rRNA (guanine(966)-N(2))-methyltransferase RsmD [Caulobacteraceae bacterium]
MRIVSGTLRGRPVRAPEGLDTRPTSDRARQAVFNILEHAPWSDGIGGLRVLDLFAGSGAMGLEALSRGAASCLFVETAEPACAAIRANIAVFKLEDRARLLRMDAVKLGQRPPHEPAFNLAFLDPPYRKGLGELALSALDEGGWLAGDSVVVLERAADEPLAHTGFTLLDERVYGAARVAFLRPSPRA